MTNQNFSFLITLFFIGLSFTTKAQINLSANHNFVTEFVIEEGFSFRFENSILVKENFMLLAYIGVSTQHTTFFSEKYYPNTIGIPVGFNLIFGQSKHHFETSIGYRWEKHYYEYPKSIRKDQYHLKLGYRYQKLKEKGIILKGGFTLGMDATYQPSDLVREGWDKIFIGGFLGVGYGL